MSKRPMDSPGSTGASLLASDARREELRARARGWPSFTVSGPTLADLEALLAGFLAPFRGYGVTAGMQNEGGLQPGFPHGAALMLDVPTSVHEQARPGSHLALRDPEGVLLAVLHVQECGQAGNVWRLGGVVEGVEQPAHDDFRERRLAPGEIRTRLRATGRRHAVAFWPGHLFHAGLRAAVIAAAERLDATLLVLIPTAPGTHDEFADVARVHALELSTRKLPADRSVVAVVPLSRGHDPLTLRLRQALLARNCGATACAVDASRLEAGTLAQLEASTHAMACPLVPVTTWSFDPSRQRLVDTGSAGEGSIAPPSAEELLTWRSEAPWWLLEPDEIEALQRAYVPRASRGFTVFFTGLSGSGKSTIARALRLRLMERTGRQVTLLDGDRVRRHLSSELGFSREHRDLNIERIGWVASEITRHRGIAICAPIAPYDRIRQQVRQMVEEAGGFVLVHVSTPLDTCEQRDRKGLYARARAGSIPEFTGISDPYETPADADLRIDTRHTSVDEACAIVIGYLVGEGYLAP
jgi:sulfate adenylyltransferase